MIALLALAVKSTLILGGVLLLCRLRFWSAAERHLLLLLAVIGLPMLLLGELMPAKAVTMVAPVSLDAWYVDRMTAEVSGPTGAAAAPIPGSVMAGLLTCLYFAGVVLLLLAWLARMLGTARFVGATRAVPVGGGVDCGAVPVRESAGLRFPLTWGIVRPEIVLPGSWQNWPPEKCRAILAHEYAHVRRRDTLTTAVSGLVCCLFWAQPLVWLAHRRLRLAAEQSCDDEVVAAGMAPAAYAEVLLEVVRGHRHGTALAMASPTGLPARIRSLLDPDLRRTPMNARRFSASATLALAVILPVGSIGAVDRAGSHDPGSSTADPRLVVEAEQGAAADVPAMSDAVYQQLGEAQQHIEAQRFDAAAAVIERLKNRKPSMNGNEIAQTHNMAGYLAFSTDDYWGAVYEYEQLLAEGDAIPEGLRMQTLYSLAQLNWVNEEYRAALERIQQWLDEAENPGPQPQVFMAQAYYQLGDHAAAIERLEAGLDRARARDVEIEADWWALLSHLYAEEGRLPEAVEVMEILNREHPSPTHRTRLDQLRGTSAETSLREI